MKGDQVKTCTKCKASKTLAEFSNKKASKDGLQSKCKACEKAYYLVNKDRHAATNAAWKAANKDRIAATWTAWRAENKDREAATNAAWRAENKDREAARVAAWYAANKEKKTATTHRRRARKELNGVFLVSSNELDRIYSSPCLACGTNDDITLGHIIPIARGGGHRVGNFISQCATCNRSQGSMLWAEWKYSSRARAVEVFAA
jgi:5-methylcytosine-specific restriction endonuclease McrA